MKCWAVAAIFAVLLVAQFCHDEAGDRRDGAALRAAQHTLDSTRALLAQAIVAADKKDTVYRNIRVRVPDTVDIHDTVAVRQYIVLADSALKRCDELADACAAVREEANAQLAASQSLIDLYQRRTKELERKIELGPRFDWSVEASRSFVVGELRIAGDADVRLFGRVHGFVRAEHTFGYPPRSDLRVGFRAFP